MHRKDISNLPLKDIVRYWTKRGENHLKWVEAEKRFKPTKQGTLRIQVLDPENNKVLMQQDYYIKAED